MKESTGSRLKQAMKSNNLRQVDLLKKAKDLYEETNTTISKTDLSQYVNNKTEPRQDKLYVLAKALDVNEAWLMGYDVPKKRTNKKQLSINENDILPIYNELNNENKKEVYDFSVKKLEKQNTKVSPITKKTKTMEIDNVIERNRGDLTVAAHIDDNISEESKKEIRSYIDRKIQEFKDGKYD